MCDLCEIWNNLKEDVKPKVYYKGSDLIILECDDCTGLIGVWREHNCNNNDDTKLRARTRNGCKKIFGDTIKFRWVHMHDIEHAHFHILGTIDRK